MKLTGNRTIVTGGTKGLGHAIVKVFLQNGATVVFCGRSSDEVSVVETELRQEFEGTAWGIMCDIASEKSVERFVSEARERLGGIDTLVNNAGVIGPIGATEQVCWTEWEETITINLLGTVRMCRAVVPGMVKAGYGKIINLSGGGATAPLPRFSAYGASKAAVVRFSETLALELLGTGVDVNAVAPGMLHTRMLNQVLEAGAEAAGENYFQTVKNGIENGTAPLTMGAELCVYLASKQSNGITGKLISAQWDPWRTLHEHLDELAKSDIYCLRRIIPEDRDQTWT